MPTGAEPSYKPGANVNAGGHTKTEPSLDARGSGEKAVNPSLDLNRQFRDLRASQSRRRKKTD